MFDARPNNSIMKRIHIITAIFLSFAFAAKAQPPYRSLASFKQDTLAYLDYNWGLYAAGSYDGKTVADFFTVYELPVKDFEIRMGDDGVLYTLRLYFRSYEWIARNHKDWDKYHVVIILQIMRDVGLPTIEELSKIFDGLERNKDVRFDWKDEYKDLFGKYEVYAVQHNYNIF